MTTYLSEELQQRVKKAVVEYVDIANSHFNPDYSKTDMEYPTVHFNLMGKTSGRARLSWNMVEFNPILLVENLERFLKTTVPHEVAHLAARWYYGKVPPHGKCWKRIMGVFGAPPNRCHSYDTTNVRKRTYTYYDFHCCCRTWKLTLKRVNKMKKGATYSCKSCGSSLVNHDIVPPRTPVPYGIVGKHSSFGGVS